MTTFASVGQNAAGSAVWILANSNGRLEITTVAGSVLEVENVPNSVPPTGQIPAKDAAGTDFLLDWTVIEATPTAVALGLGDPDPAAVRRNSLAPSSAALSLASVNVQPGLIVNASAASSTIRAGVGIAIVRTQLVRPSAAALSLGDPAPALTVTTKPSSAALSLGDPSSSEKATARPSAAALSLGDPVPREKTTTRPSPAALSLGEPDPSADGRIRIAPGPAALSLGDPVPREKTTTRPSAAAIGLPAPTVRASVPILVFPSPAVLALASGVELVRGGNRFLTPAPAVLELHTPAARVRNLKRGGLRARASAGLAATGQARFSLSTVVLLEGLSTRGRR